MKNTRLSINGRKIDISSWLRQGKSGMYIKYNEKEANRYMVCLSDINQNAYAVALLTGDEKATGSASTDSQRMTVKQTTIIRSNDDNPFRDYHKMVTLEDLINKYDEDL
jgi:hypothetical protein